MIPAVAIRQLRCSYGARIDLVCGESELETKFQGFSPDQIQSHPRQRHRRLFNHNDDHQGHVTHRGVGC